MSRRRRVIIGGPAHTVIVRPENSDVKVFHTKLHELEIAHAEVIFSHTLLKIDYYQDRDNYLYPPAHAHCIEASHYFRLSLLFMRLWVVSLSTLLFTT